MSTVTEDLADDKKIKEEELDEEEEEKTFEELGLEPRLVRALEKKDISKPTPIQLSAIPLILEGKDVVARAKTGSGKTYAYLLPILQKLFSDSGLSKKTAPSAFILVPTRELCQQVYSEVDSLIKHCKVQMKVVSLTSGMANSDLRAALSGPPEILVSTPACISTAISSGVLDRNSIRDSISILVLDEADLLLSYGYEDDLKVLTPHIPRSCQCLLMSATSSDDVEKLKKLVLHNPVILTQSEVGDSKDDIVPKNVQQFWISCNVRDKLVYILPLLKLELVQKKVLIFVNTIDMAFRLRLFLEQFGIKAAILNAELPHNSRMHILEKFNAGMFDYLIATDDSHIKDKAQENGNNSNNNNVQSQKSKKHRKPKLDSEFGVVRGIDFKNVFTVINFDMPLSAAGYVHRIGRTGRAHNTGASVSLVSSDETEIFNEIKATLGEEDENEEGSNFIAPFPLLTQNAVESLRYRAEDVAKSVTKVAVRQARAQDLRNEMLNSETLKAQVNPREKDLLEHGIALSKKPSQPHLRQNKLPEYLIDPTTQEASKIVKLTRAAMGNTSNRRSTFPPKARRNRGTLKEGGKKFQKGGKRKDRDMEGERKKKKKARDV